MLLFTYFKKWILSTVTVPVTRKLLGWFEIYCPWANSSLVHLTCNLKTIVFFSLAVLLSEKPTLVKSETVKKLRSFQKKYIGSNKLQNKPERKSNSLGSIRIGMRLNLWERTSSGMSDVLFAISTLSMAIVGT